MPSPWMRSVRSSLTPRSPHTAPLVCVAVAVLAANLPTIAHLVASNPLVVDGGLTFPIHGWLPGVPYIDPNAGYTAQALGHLAASDWLHGHVPWWNPYEGIGAPLAGEMQSGAFFPTTLLLALRQGPLLVQLVLELVTGWSTYFLVRRLGVGRTVATAAGVAFGLCGTYAWLAHAPVRPVALLPLCLIGVERAVDAGRARRPGGWALLAVALALSILAGFPETTLLDGALVGLWAVLRLVESGTATWRPIIGKLVAGGVVGLALAAPLIAAFTSYLPSAELGSHGSGFAYAAVPRVGLVQTVLPYGLGPIFGFHTSGSDVFTSVWGNVGGYLTATLIAAGLVGLAGRRHRLLRLGLGGWITLCLLRTFGSPPVLHAMAAVPGFKAIAFYRYADPSWELAVVVLAALGLDDVARLLTRRRALVTATAATALVAGWAAVTAWPLLTGAFTGAPSAGVDRHAYLVGSLVLAGAGLAVLAAGGLLAGRGGPGRGADRSRRWGRVLMAGAVATETVLLFGFPPCRLRHPPPCSSTPSPGSSTTSAPSASTRSGRSPPTTGRTSGSARPTSTISPCRRRGSTTSRPTSTPMRSGGCSTGSRGSTRAMPPRPRSSPPTWPDSRRSACATWSRVPTGSTSRGSRFRRWERRHGPPGRDWSTGTGSPRSGSSRRPPRCSRPRRAAGRPGRGLFGHRVGWAQVAVDCPRPSTLVRRVQYEEGWTASVDGSPVYAV